MTTPNPLKNTFAQHYGGTKRVSKTTHHIAGILTTVYGLEELSAQQDDVACLWLLHPRLQTQDCMQPVAEAAIDAWKSSGEELWTKKGLIAVSFDQRNHGSREVSARANEAWMRGNATHAQDMYGVYEGTTVDLAHIQRYLPAYVFNQSSSKHRRLVQHLVLGVSLGGHAVWHCLMHNPSIEAGIVVIGCPDYIRLMAQRAVKSKLVASEEQLLGSEHFPKALVDVINATDPAAVLMRPYLVEGDQSVKPKDANLAFLRPLMAKHLGGKKVLNLSGGADKLVPYSQSQPFMDFLEAATARDGWFADGGLSVRDVVFDGVGHDMSPGMISEMETFLIDVLRGSTQGQNKL